MTEEINGFKKVIDEMVSLKEKKSGDYQESWKVLGIQGIFYQIARKFTRIWINKNKDPKEMNFESLRDSLMDNAVYSIMGIQLLDEGLTEDQVDKLLRGK